MDTARWGRGGGRKESGMETYTLACYKGGQWELAVWLRELKPGLILRQPRGVAWAGRWEGGSRGKGRVYTYGWSMLMYGRDQHNAAIILQLKINKLRKKTLCKMFIMDTYSIGFLFFFVFSRLGSGVIFVQGPVYSLELSLLQNQ